MLCIRFTAHRPAVRQLPGIRAVPSCSEQASREISGPSPTLCRSADPHLHHPPGISLNSPSARIYWRRIVVTKLKVEEKLY